MANLSIGETLVNSEEVARKVELDIAFLTDRLARMEQQRSPNPVIIQTYKDMLDSRYAVLHWLRQDHTTTDAKAVNQ